MNVRGDFLGPPHGTTTRALICKVKKISNDQELIQSDSTSCPQGTEILKSDCKQPLRIGIIRALNECTGRRFRAATRHNHKSSDMQSKKISNEQELTQSDPTSCPQGTGILKSDCKQPLRIGIIRALNESRLS